MAYNYANNYSTTLASAVTSTGATTISVTSATGAPSANFPLLIDTEIMLVTGVSGTTFTVTRGVEGTSAATHSNGAVVSNPLTADSLLNMPMGGDVTGTSAAAVVAKLQGQAVSATGVTKGQFLMGTAASAYGPVSGSGDVSWSTGTAGLATVTAIQGNTVTSGALTKGQIFIASSTSNWAASDFSGDISNSHATAGLITVTGLQGIAVPSPSGTNTVLQYNSSAYTWATGAGVSYTIQPIYGTNNQTITITLNSLANSTAGVGRASTVIDNSSTLAEDALISLIIVSASSGVGATGFITVYGYGTTNGGTNYTESATGSDAGLTVTQPPNSFAAVFNIVATSHTYNCGPFSFCKAFGFDRLPQKWGIIAVNTSGAALASSGNSANYQVINGKLV